MLRFIIKFRDQEEAVILRFNVASPQSERLEKWASWLRSLKTNVGVALLFGIVALVIGLVFNQEFAATAGVLAIATGVPTFMTVAAMEQVALDRRFRAFELNGEYGRCGTGLARICEILLAETGDPEIRRILFESLMGLEKAQKAGQPPLDLYSAATAALRVYLS